MGSLSVLALRVVLGLGFLGALFVQVVMVPLIWRDLDGGEAARWQQVAFCVVAVLGMVALEVVIIGVARLTAMVRRGTLFSDAAFRHVDTVIAATAAGAVLMLGVAAIWAPGEAVAPGVVLIICGIALLIGGVALIVLVMRALLRQAVDRDTQARTLQAELDEVI